LLDLYGEFVKKASEGRNKKEEDMETLAQGRVYSGLTAQSLGLIDSLGGYLEALETARKLADIPASKKIRVREYPRPKFFEVAAARFFSSALIREQPPASGRSSSIADASALAAGFFQGIFPSRGWKTSQIWSDLVYRVSQNGRIMPLLPLGLE
jgi:ClpP class serine protease